MTSPDRVLAACAFRRPDRIPRWEGSFLEYPDSWFQRLGPLQDLSDISIWAPDETPFPTRARRLKEESGWIYEMNGWGTTIRRRADAYFNQTLEVAMPEGADPDAVEFEPPQLDLRYDPERMWPPEYERDIERAKRKHCVFAKTGGPYLRTTLVRGEAQFLLDIAGDPGLAKALADKVGDHLTAVGVEAVRRWSLQDSGIWIFDDMACNSGPMFSPAAFERIFLPAYRRMIGAYKQAGAKYVGLHCDGDPRALLDMLIDAGIQALNPVEPRANMDVVRLRELYPRLILTGGMCNTATMVKGPIEKIEAEARRIIDVGRDGGVIIGHHSISPEVPLEHFLAYQQTCLTYGDFTATDAG
ncbi:MAG TPA: uroporphyrinogen decarboxylase family protein [Armatimonadota bacterium]|nr:uroporphyrinogen decarboxylase family protein [Armatimonadota bacterium]